jgi:hypothetical protein
VDTFISHWWGSPLKQTLDALIKHDPTQKQRIWICSVANNQWRVAQELGDDIEASPFKQALASDSCKCMALMLDTDGAPLTRYWCLYEIMTVIRLRSNGRPMELDLCTPKGVINRGGNMKAEDVIKLSDMIANIDVAHAKCWQERDRNMITSAINEHLGGFEKMNMQIREFVEQGLHVMYGKLTERFHETHAKLGLGRSFHCKRQTSPGLIPDEAPTSPGLTSDGILSPTVPSVCWEETPEEIIKKLKQELEESKAENKRLRKENVLYHEECIKLREEDAKEKCVARFRGAANAGMRNGGNATCESTRSPAPQARRSPKSSARKRGGNDAASIPQHEL